MPPGRDPDRWTVEPVAPALTRPARHRASARSPGRAFSEPRSSSRAERCRPLTGVAAELRVEVSPFLVEGGLEPHRGLQFPKPFVATARLEEKPADARVGIGVGRIHAQNTVVGVQRLVVSPE